MCGRYTLTTDISDLQIRFSFHGHDLEYRPRYNIAPTQRVLTVTNEEETQAQFMKWGLIPSWAKDPSIGSRMINARGETIAEKPSFRTALRKRRCLVLADGFYEWKKAEGQKVPMRITLKEEEPFAFAGLWEAWKSPEDEWVRSCTIITTAPNTLMEPIHNRMPVILPQEAEETWLNPAIEDPQVLTSFFQPFPAEAMEVYPVSTMVNSVKNDAAECIN